MGFKNVVNLGDRIKVQTIRGVKGNVIGRLSDGRAVLFDSVHPKYVIVDPVSKPVPITEEPNGSRAIDEYLREDLESLANVEDIHVSTTTRALLYIIDRLDRHRL